ncbi:DNA polymerase delta subunit 4, partial [Tanacetum coccineum]
MKSLDAPLLLQTWFADEEVKPESQPHPLHSLTQKKNTATLTREKEGDKLRSNLDVIEIIKSTQFPQICEIPNANVPDKKSRPRNDWDAFLNKDQNHDAMMRLLRQFDMNMAYGTCVGMKRVDRWNRASSLGLNLPENIQRFLTSVANEVSTDSTWDCLNCKTRISVLKMSDDGSLTTLAT